MWAQQQKQSSGETGGLLLSGIRSRAHLRTRFAVLSIPRGVLWIGYALNILSFIVAALAKTRHTKVCNRPKQQNGGNELVHESSANAKTHIRNSIREHLYPSL